MGAHPDPPDGTIIAALVDRADRMGRELAAEPFPRVLCHTDLHTWNVLVDAGRRLWIVDWDEAVLAPPGRDLMFVVGGGIGPAGRPGRHRRLLPGLRAVQRDGRLVRPGRVVPG